MKILKIKEKILKTVLVLIVSGVSILGTSNLLIHKFISNYGEILKDIEKNIVIIESKLVDKETSAEEKEKLMTMINLYLMSRECMDYYKIESIDDYMKLQRKMYRTIDLEKNYGRYSLMKKEKEKLTKYLNID